MAEKSRFLRVEERGAGPVALFTPEQEGEFIYEFKEMHGRGGSAVAVRVPVTEAAFNEATLRLRIKNKQARDPSADISMEERGLAEISAWRAKHDQAG